ncbi:transposase [Georgenia sp. M64]|uniref:IS110 family transposase n=1 Tax=Georgenia sp. M64 TaxID=3120520 RepID=UPI0030DE8D56
MFTNTIPAARERWVVGLDVHARSISASALDLLTGELINARLAADPATALRFVTGLGADSAVAYEAGPTGFGLARALDQAAIRCVVAAPSKIARAPGDRVKTDKRDATLLARRLAAGDLTAVRVPSPTEEAARDLTRAHEDARADLMSARHRASKLLLRHGIVYSGGAPGAGTITPGWPAPTSTSPPPKTPSRTPTNKSCCSRSARGTSPPRSPTWPPTASSPTSSTPWAACAASPCSPRCSWP